MANQEIVKNYHVIQSKFETIHALYEPSAWHGWLCAYFIVSPKPTQWLERICIWFDIEDKK